MELALIISPRTSVYNMRASEASEPCEVCEPEVPDPKIKANDNVHKLTVDYLEWF